jgi:cytochrome c-type biogenesis protein CcmE
MNQEKLELSNNSFARHRLRIFIAAVVLVGTLIYFATLAFQSAMVYYYTVSEITEQPATPLGKMVRVSGTLVPESFHRTEGATTAHFQLTDGITVIEAQHDGVLPGLFFNDHSEIILEGIHNPETHFNSQNVIVKCPSKYVAIEDKKINS